MIHTHYDKEKNVLLVKLSGAINSEKLLNYIESFGRLKELTSQLRVLQDLHEAVLDIDMETVQQAGMIIGEQLRWFDSIKVASVFNDPKSTAYSLLIEGKADFEGYEHKVFSSLESAMIWIEG